MANKPDVGAGSGGKDAKTEATGADTPRKRAPTGQTPVRGNRPVREFYLNEADLREISKASSTTTLLFTLATGCFGFALNLHKDIAFASGVAAETMATWAARQEIAAFLSACFFIAGTVSAIAGRNTVEKIKTDTVFSDGFQYKTSWWTRWYFPTLLVVIALIAGYWLRKSGY